MTARFITTHCVDTLYGSFNKQLMGKEMSFPNLIIRFYLGMRDLFKMKYILLFFCEYVYSVMSRELDFIAYGCKKKVCCITNSRVYLLYVKNVRFFFVPSTQLCKKKAFFLDWIPIAWSKWLFRNKHYKPVRRSSIHSFRVQRHNAETNLKIFSFCDKVSRNGPKAINHCQFCPWSQFPVSLILYKKKLTVLEKCNLIWRLWQWTRSLPLVFITITLLKKVEPCLITIV